MDHAPGGDFPWSARRLNRLAAVLGAATYLEVGVGRGDTLLHIDVAERTGVDPAFRLDVAATADDRTHLAQMTSDDFFAGLPPHQTFDLVFLDGLHNFEQTYRDLTSTLLHSHARSAILIDDTRPSDVYSSLRDLDSALRFRAASGDDGPAWHGDVFKVVFAIHDLHPGLDYRTIKGGGNAQTLVWRSAAGRREPRLDSFEAISRLTYFDLMDALDVLRLTSEDEAIESCVSALGP